MGRRPNHRFSIERDREVTAFEFGIDLIKRGLTGSIIKRDRDKSKVLLDLLSPLLPKMPTKQQSYEDGSSNSTSKRRATLTNGEKSELNQDLSTYNDYVMSLAQSFNDTCKEIRAFQKISQSHTSKIDTAMRDYEKITQLKKEVREQKTTINVLRREQQESEVELDKERKKLREEEEQLRKKIDKFEKDKATEDEAAKKREIDKKAEQDKILEQKETRLEKKYNAMKKEFENSVSKKEKAMSEEIKNLKTEKAGLQQRYDALKAKTKDLDEQLGKTQSDNENLRIANKALKDERKALTKELNDAKNVFGLNQLSTEDYHKQFTNIYDDISAISHQYFQDLEVTEPRKVQEKLKAIDPCFASIPFSNSDDAKALRMVHAQRIISGHVRKAIWQPFSSERSKEARESMSLLSAIASNLKSNQGVNGAYISKIWSALTERALQSPLAKPSTPDLAERVVERILEALSPLIRQTEVQNFKNDMLKLVQSASVIWNTSQTDELEITICSELDPERRDEWRSLDFDPPSTSTNKKTAKTDIPSATRNRIFILFPRIEARSFSKLSGSRPTPPGGWPESEAEQTPPPVETCIYPGVGLLESSALVLRGHEEVEHLAREEEEEKRYLQQKLEELKKNYKSNKENIGDTKKNLVLTINEGPPSPTEQWKMSGRNAEVLK